MRYRMLESLREFATNQLTDSDRADAVRRHAEYYSQLVDSIAAEFFGPNSQAAIETLEKMARALEVPMYQLFYEGEEPPKLPNLLNRKSSDDIAWGSTGKDARFLNKLRRSLGKATVQDRKIILLMAQKMALR